MNKTDKAYVEGYSVFKDPEPIHEDTLFVWLTGITAVASVVAMLVWIISIL